MRRDSARNRADIGNAGLLHALQHVHARGYLVAVLAARRKQPLLLGLRPAPAPLRVCNLARASRQPIAAGELRRQPAKALRRKLPRRLLDRHEENASTLSRHLVGNLHREGGLAHRGNGTEHGQPNREATS